MRSTTPPALALALLAAGLPAPAAAQAPRGVIHQQLALLLNPMGAQHTLRLGIRDDIGDQEELLFSGAHAEAGVVSYLSPVFAIQGGYLEVSPLSFLVLRAELTQASVWAIGMDKSGFYGLDGYDADVQPQTLTADRGGGATGWSAAFGAQLQGAIPLGDLRILIADALSLEHRSLGESPYYYSMRWDLVLARQDWLVTNEAYLLGEGHLAPDVVLHGGLYDDLRFVPASGYLGHQVGPIAALTFEEIDPALSSLTIFVRGGYYTDHVTRGDELTVLGGVSVDYDLGAIQ